MKKHTYEFVKEYIESFGYKLLSKEYINSYTKLLIKCPKGHEYKISFNSFKQGYRCSYCCGNAKYIFEDIEEYIRNFNYTLLSDKYKNSASKLSLVCPLGHEFEMSWDSFKNKNHRCPICARSSNADKHRLLYKNVKENIESFNYTLLSEEYVDYQTKLLVRCPYGHEYEVRYANFQQGSRCPICKISKGEQKITDWLNKNNINYIYNKPYFNDLLSQKGNLLRPDFIIEDKKIWIEYDGEYHYQDVYNDGSYERTKNYDELKNQYANKNGWTLIRIPYWEFDNIEIILENLIKNK